MFFSNTLRAFRSCSHSPNDSSIVIDPQLWGFLRDIVLPVSNTHFIVSSPLTSIIWPSLTTSYDLAFFTIALFVIPFSNDQNLIFLYINCVLPTSITLLLLLLLNYFIYFMLYSRFTASFILPSFSSLWTNQFVTHTIVWCVLCRC